MFIESIRSSSYNKFDFCPHSYLLEYVLGYKFPSNRKACVGNVTHKALELLSLDKLAKQNNKKRFTEDESGLSFRTGSITPMIAAAFGVSHYNKIQSDFTFGEADEQQVYDWLTGLQPKYTPSNRRVLSVERFFELDIVEDWALLDNGKHLKLFGTIDLLLDKIDSSCDVEYVDWKTGKRLDWATGEIKTLEKLYTDPQLRIYHYAMSRLFPQHNRYAMTVYYTADGGPFTVNLTKDDVDDSLHLIRDRFLEIKNNGRPKLIWPDWKCSKLCPAFHPKPGENKGLCQKINEEIDFVGLEEVTLRYKKDIKYVGGGRQ